MTLFRCFLMDFKQMIIIFAYIEKKIEKKKI